MNSVETREMRPELDLLLPGCLDEVAVVTVSHIQPDLSLAAPVTIGSNKTQVQQLLCIKLLHVMNKMLTELRHFSG